MSDIKGIILDVDGVIIGEKIGFNSPHPHIEVINKLKQIKRKGINITLCTAKPYFAIQKEIESAGLNNLHITDGGSVIINPIDNVIQNRHILDREQAKSVIEMCIANNIYVEFYTVDDYFIQRSEECELTKQHIHILQKAPIIVENLAEISLEKEVTKIMPIALNDGEDKERVNNLYKQLNVDLAFNWSVHPVALPLQFGIVTATGISKKQGLIEISRSSNIPLENILGVGDSTSDWNFIELCGYAAAMGNASNELKELVKTKGENNSYIGEHVNENGIVGILNHFVK